MIWFHIFIFNFSNQCRLKSSLLYHENTSIHYKLLMIGKLIYNTLFPYPSSWTELAIFSLPFLAVTIIYILSLSNFILCFYSPPKVIFCSCLVSLSLEPMQRWRAAIRAEMISLKKCCLVPTRLNKMKAHCSCVPALSPKMNLSLI